MLLDIKEESFEELDDLSEANLWEILLSQCPEELEIHKRKDYAIKNLKYPNLPMVHDLQNATQAL